MDEAKAAMIPGKLYLIVLDDCCIQGEIKGRFIEWDEDQAIFDIGRIGPEWGKWTPTEINEI